ncbi:hypothetical protein GGI25_002869 [Coemansia spiralis]|uniref:Uncharacterized protein n=1 Tax=Coemansia spiralis TaxID=417178 RepID=A0A9W8G712_9FUNG|nr:hypothetical protein GGI25_002869 [Coemansia spiralis]
MYTLNTFVYKADHLFGVQNYDLLPIDYVQGKVDMNFAFFFDVPPYNSQHLDTNCFRESLIKTIKSFPILTGHIVNAAEQGTNWKVHVDPSNINWPEVTESTAPN